MNQTILGTGSIYHAIWTSLIQRNQKKVSRKL